MDRTAATHSTHDELLLARLYGDDVDESQRARALDLISSCSECADLFADLGSIAQATSALATPPRPRDFTLTEADAAKARRLRRGRAMFEWLARTRALGGSMVAAGLLGVVLVGAISAFPSSSSADRLSQNQPVPAAANQGNDSGAPVTDQSGSGKGAESSAATGYSATAAPAAMPTAAPATGDTLVQSPATAVAASPAASVVALGPPAPTAQPVPSGEAVFGPTTAGQGRFAASPSSAPAGGHGVQAAPAAGQELRLVALAAFAALAFLGVLLLAVPRLAARRARR
jgi:hypothetical protein